jgi:hypothetical protein
LKFKNFKFTRKHLAAQPENLQVKRALLVYGDIDGNPPLVEKVVIEDVVVDGDVSTAQVEIEKGVAVTQAKDVVVKCGSVRNTSKYGYGVHGDNENAIAENVTIAGALSEHNGTNGFEINLYGGKVTLDGVRALSNEGSGIFVLGVRPPGDLTKLLDFEAAGNEDYGVRGALGSIEIENGYIHGNHKAGVWLNEGAGFTPGVPTRASILSSTIINNSTNYSSEGFVGQVVLDRRNLTSVIADSILAHTTAAEGSRGRALRYRKGGSSITRWTNSLFYRQELAEPLVTVTDGASNPSNPFLACTLNTSVNDCDTVGDCDNNGAVITSELNLGRDISLGLAPGSSCIAADENRDGIVSVEERISAVIASSTGEGHNNIVVAQPTFTSTGRLAVGSAGEDVGIFPSTLRDVLDREINLCRVDECDLTGRTRDQAVTGNYDMGAFEENGGPPQGACITSPGECLAQAPVLPTATVQVQNRVVCSTVDSFNANIAIFRNQGPAISGAQFDLQYDPTLVTLNSCAPSANNPSFTVQFEPMGSGLVRVMFGDFDPTHQPRATVSSNTPALVCSFNTVGGNLLSNTILTPTNVVMSSAAGNRLKSQGISGQISSSTSHEYCGSGC